MEVYKKGLQRLFILACGGVLLGGCISSGAHLSFDRSSTQTENQPEGVQPLSNRPVGVPTGSISSHQALQGGTSSALQQSSSENFSAMGGMAVVSEQTAQSGRFRMISRGRGVALRRVRQ